MHCDATLQPSCTVMRSCNPGDMLGGPCARARPLVEASQGQQPRVAQSAALPGLHTQTWCGQRDLCQLLAAAQSPARTAVALARQPRPGEPGARLSCTRRTAARSRATRSTAAASRPAAARRRRPATPWPPSAAGWGQPCPSASLFTPMHRCHSQLGAPVHARRGAARLRLGGRLAVVNSVWQQRPRRLTAGRVRPAVRRVRGGRALGGGLLVRGGRRRSRRGRRPQAAAAAGHQRDGRD